MRQCSLCFFSVQQQKRLTQLLLFWNSSQPDAPVNKIQRFFCGFGSAACTVLCYALKLCLVRQYAPVLCTGSISAITASATAVLSVP